MRTSRSALQHHPALSYMYKYVLDCGLYTILKTFPHSHYIMGSPPTSKQLTKILALCDISISISEHTVSRLHMIKKSSHRRRVFTCVYVQTIYKQNQHSSSFTSARTHTHKRTINSHSVTQILTVNNRPGYGQPPTDRSHNKTHSTRLAFYRD